MQDLVARDANPPVDQTTCGNHDEIVYFDVHIFSHPEAGRAESLLIAGGPSRTVRCVHQRHLPAKRVEVSRTEIGDDCHNVYKPVVLPAVSVTLHLVVVEFGIVHECIGLSEYLFEEAAAGHNSSVYKVSV